MKHLVYRLFNWLFEDISYPRTYRHGGYEE